jgi:predicted nucleotidyltransferase component of viral defense system
LLVLNYGSDNRNLKVEISNIKYNDRYQNLNYLGISVKVMHIEDMFAHKLCALTDHQTVAGRDVYDIYHFLNDNVRMNHEIIRKRSKMNPEAYIDDCIKTIKSIKKTSMLHGIGELMDIENMVFVKEELKEETISLLNIYKNFYL